MQKAQFAGIQEQFRQDAPHTPATIVVDELIGGRIVGCTAVRMPVASDDRGDLIELLSTRNPGIAPIVHVYQVICTPMSIRAWVYHERQTDRLCFTDGTFRIALCDLRPDSPTNGAIVTIFAGAEAPVLVTIPPFVVHGVQSVGDTRASFVNLPTDVYSYERPDKRRLAFDSPLIPYTW